MSESHDTYLVNSMAIMSVRQLAVFTAASAILGCNREYPVLVVELVMKM